MTKIKIQVSARFLMTKGLWEDFCDRRDISLYAVRDGMDIETMFELDEQEIKDYFVALCERG